MEIPLSNRDFGFTVSAEDHNAWSAHRWRLNNQGQPITTIDRKSITALKFASKLVGFKALRVAETLNYSRENLKKRGIVGAVRSQRPYGIVENGAWHKAGKHVVLVDAKFPMRHKYHIGADGYARRTEMVNGKRETTFLAWDVLDNVNKFRGEAFVRYRNGFANDCRLENLIIVPRKQFIRTGTRYQGVYKDHKRWRARVSVNGKRIPIGGFDSELDAAGAVDHVYQILRGHKPNDTVAPLAAKQLKQVTTELAKHGVTLAA